MSRFLGSGHGQGQITAGDKEIKLSKQCQTEILSLKFSKTLQHSHLNLYI